MSEKHTVIIAIIITVVIAGAIEVRQLGMAFYLALLALLVFLIYKAIRVVVERPK